MKMKLLWIIWLAAFIFLLAGCGRRNNTAATTAKESLVESLTTAEFKEKITDYEANPQEWIYRGDKPAIVDFYATWCGPCKKISPIMEELAREYSGRVLFYKIDVDEEPDVALAFGVQSIPTLLFIPVGRNPSYVKGAHSTDNYRRRIQTLLLPTEQVK